MHELIRNEKLYKNVHKKRQEYENNFDNDSNKNIYGNDIRNKNDSDTDTNSENDDNEISKGGSDDFNIYDDNTTLKEKWVDPYPNPNPYYIPFTPPLSNKTPSPPSGVQPFLGFTNYFAPLCYLYSNQSTLYSTASSLWRVLWCKLNVLSSDSGTLLHICKTFENLLGVVNPKLYLHLLNLGISPLHVVFPWIQMSFVSFFEIDQLLILWDRVIGYMDLTIYALLSTAIFIARAEPLFLCTNTEKAIAILNEGTRLKVIPLLQMFLYSE